MIAAKWCKEKGSEKHLTQKNKINQNKSQNLTQVETKVQKPTQHHLEKGSKYWQKRKLKQTLRNIIFRNLYQILKSFVIKLIQ
nr:hypothetical protein [Mycoplasmopsis bovis]